MALLPVSLLPGIYTEGSPRAVLNRFKAGRNVRFFKGNAQKVGGCEKSLPLTMFGVCRSLLSWTTLSLQRLIGLGTSAKLYLCDTNAFFDVTPVDATGTLGADPFAMTNGSKTVTVHHVAHGRNVGDYANYAGATLAGGLDMNGDHLIDVVIDDNNYSVQMPAAANATVAGGGVAVVFIYDIHAGNVDSVIGHGWGAGGWGTGTWGTPRVSLVLQLARIWNLANWGEDMVASPVDSKIYIWIAAGGTNTRAVVIPEAPAQNRKVLVSDQIRIMISFGSHDGTTADPMLIRWSDSEDYHDWTPSPTNLAGDKRLDKGSEIISALITRDEFAVITDATIYSMTLSGDNLVFNFSSKGDTPGLVGPNGAVDVNGVVYVMGLGEFYTYDGTINPLDCDVYSPIFKNINISQAAKVVLARNKLKTEIIGFYPSAGSLENDLCFGYNYVDKNWWLGTVKRTAWLDTNTFYNIPIATNPDPATAGSSLLYIQEIGVDDDGAPLPYSISTYDLEIGGSNNFVTGTVSGAGQSIVKLTRIFPDFVRIVGRHFASFVGRKYPQGRDIKKGPKVFYPGKERVDMHIRARQVSITIASDELGADIEMGAWRTDSRDQGDN